MEAPRYRPLDTTANEIRLLFVDRENASGLVRCKLRHYPLPSSPPYVALSYAWCEPSTREGEATSKEMILVDGQDFLVTTNLALALRTLRVETTCIWVDALCIDQSNTAERSAQVSIMRMIYERAKKVVVWLGPEKDEGTLALDFIETVAKQREEADFLVWLMDTVRGNAYQREWTAFQRLFERGWWTRTWALQEFVLGKDVDFVCGHRILAAENLEKALEQTYHYGLSLSKILHDRLAICLNTMTLRNLITLISCRRWRKEGKPLPLLPVLNIVTWTSCSDPRDKVYGILGIVTDPGIAKISPDYSLPTREVYRNLVRNHIESELTLDILGFAKPSNLTKGLPSWVPDWSAASVRWPISQRVRGYSSRRTSYCADKSTAAIAFFSPDSSVLICRGALIDRIDGMSLPTVPESLLDIHESQPMSSANAYGEDIDMFDALWRTFVGDANYPDEPDINAPLSFRPLFAKKCLKAEADLSANDHDRSRGNDSLGGWFHDVRGFTVAGRPLSRILLGHGKQYAAADISFSAGVSIAFEQSVQIMRSGRRLITTTKGYIGLAPSGVKRGDHVCVLLGCLVPLILRSVDGHFQVIGDSYIHGMMHGEALDGVESGIFPLRDFELR